MPAANLTWNAPPDLPPADRCSRESNAFAISSKLGLPDYIIDKAKEQISEQDESFEDVLSSLESSRITIENERREIEQYKQEIASLKSEMESKQEKLNEQRDPHGLSGICGTSS